MSANQSLTRLPFHDLRRQPFRSLYLIYAFTTLFLIRVPIWTLLSLRRSNRSRPSWSIGRNVLVKILYWASGLIPERAGYLETFPSHKQIAAGKGVKGIWVGAAPALITGELRAWAEMSNVKSVPVPGYWIDNKASDVKVGERAKPGEKVIYFLHGGAYIFLSAHPSSPTSGNVDGLLRFLPSIRRAFCLEYRLSASEPYPVRYPFPAALLDAVAGYNYLVDVVGFEPANIITVGDSAGGNLAQALTRYLVEHQGAADVNLPACPGHLLLLSPWCDISRSHDTPGSSSYTNVDSDYIGTNSSATMTYARLSFLGPHGSAAAELNPYISPASKNPGVKVSFKGFPKTMIVAGEAEGLLDQIVTLKDRMKEDLGDKLTYFGGRDAIHDYLAFPWFEPQRSDTLKEITKWVSQDS